MMKVIVNHKNLYLRVEGKLTKQVVGSQIDVSKDQFEQLGDKVVDPTKTVKPAAKPKAKPKANAKATAKASATKPAQGTKPEA